MEQIFNEQDARHVEAYLRRYWRRIDESTPFVPREYLPKFMTLARKLGIYICADGYLALAYLKDGDALVQYINTTRRVIDVLANQPFTNDKGARSHMTMGVEFQGPGTLHLAEPQMVLNRAQRPKVVYSPPWLHALAIVKQVPALVLVNPEREAEKDIKFFAFARRLGVEKSPVVEQTQEKVIAALEGLLDKFSGLLSEATREEEIQKFIEANTILLAPFSQKEDVHAKHQLGKEWVSDFVVENKPPLPFSHTFVEIEPASESVFLKAKGREREFTSRANHAVAQLADWRIWMRDNIAYFRRDFPTVDQCNYLLVMGRSNELSSDQKRRLDELNSEHPWRKVLTYDDLKDQLAQLIANLKTMVKPA